MTRRLLLSAAVLAAFVPLRGAAQQPPAATTNTTPSAPPPGVAAVAEIAAGSGFIDVVGVKLGARLIDAMTALKAYSPKMTFRPVAYPRYEVLPKVDFGHTVIGHAQGPQYQPGDDTEDIVMRVMMPPSPLLVWEMFRHIEWKSGTGPSAEKVLTGLRQKYGPETGKGLMQGAGAELWWFYDRQGHHLTTEQMVPALGQAADQAPMYSCSPFVIGTPPEMDWLGFNRVDAISDAPEAGFFRSTAPYQELLERGFDQDPSEHDKTRMGREVLEPFLRAQEFCRDISVVYVTLLRDPTLDQMHQLNVSARSVPLMRAAFNLSHAMLQQAIQDKIQREKEAASKLAAPKF